MRYLALLTLYLVVTASLWAGTHDQRYRSATVDATGQLHIMLASGREVLPKRIKNQVAFGEASVSPNHKTVGWLAYYPYPGVSYNKVDPIPQSLVLYQSGRILHTFPTGQIFWSWEFLNGGSQVAYSTGPTHGGGGECVLRDVQTGSVLAQWFPERDSDQPIWTKGLRF